jgi:hypothetical protein
LIQISAPLVRIHLQHGFEDVLDLLPAFPGHEAFLFICSIKPSPRRSPEAFTVVVETESTSTVSVIEIGSRLWQRDAVQIALHGLVRENISFRRTAWTYVGYI